MNNLFNQIEEYDTCTQCVNGVYDHLHCVCALGAKFKSSNCKFVSIELINNKQKEIKNGMAKSSL